MALAIRVFMFLVSSDAEARFFGSEVLAQAPDRIDLGRQTKAVLDKKRE